jgi:hypothetical protein
MSPPEDRIGDPPLSKRIESAPGIVDDLEMFRLSGARTRAMEEAGAEIARQLNGPLTALTIESHRAEAMRKPGARNTADLVRTALLHPDAV